jgi:hypothetical protein
MIMFLPVIYLGCLLSADVPGTDGAGSGRPRLVVIPNVRTILQRDHLCLMVLVENHATSDIRLTGTPTIDGRYVQFELRQTGSWQPAPKMNEGPKNDESMGHRGRAVLSGSEYVEFSALQRDRARFLFEGPGKYQLRGTVQTTFGPLVSEPVTITAESRPAEQLQRIEQAAEILPKLELRNLRWNRPEELLALKGVGGNIGYALKNAQLLQEYAKAGTIDGGIVALEDLPDLLRQRLDAVNWEGALQLLGQHFMNAEELPGMKVIGRAMPHDSFRRRALFHQLRFRADPTTPQWAVRSDFGQNGRTSNDRVESD